MGEVLLDVILFLVLSRAFWKLVGGVIAGISSKPQAPRAADRGIQMARDPVCGTFVVPERAVALTDGRERLYFCSTTCRDQYQAHSTSSGHVHGRSA
jgi:YHS domain-containing protein